MADLAQGQVTPFAPVPETATLSAAGPKKEQLIEWGHAPHHMPGLEAQPGPAPHLYLKCHPSQIVRLLDNLCT